MRWVPLILALALLAAACQARRDPSLDLATTTSVQNSGLLDRLLPAFREETALEVRVHLTGSGRALEMMRHGEADVVLSHAPETEAAALGANPAWRYRKLMFNDFVVVGPAQDPARVRGLQDAVEAFRRIAASEAPFTSRGDKSGTHERETQLWTLARASPRHLLTTGTGMAATLRQTDEQSAYTLTDRATFVQLEPRLTLELLVEGDARLLNTYAVLVSPGTRQNEAWRFAVFLTEGRGRDIIDAYRLTGGAQAFHVWPHGCPGNAPGDRPCHSRP
ncbi:MAG: substrate-binding domain-containing protein [Vicinamibacterales bacterium]